MEERASALLGVPPHIAVALEAYIADLHGAYADHTVRALRGDIRALAAWCAPQGGCPLPAAAETVVSYLEAIGARHAVATVRRRVASIGHLHRALGLPDPTAERTVKLTLRRLVRSKGTRQRQAAPINGADAALIVATAGASIRDLRDIALLLCARDTLARRSELIAMRVDHLKCATDGSGTILIPRAKGDQEGAGAMLWLSPPTMEAISRWRDAAGIENGSLFRSVRRGGRGVGGALSADAVARIVKRLGARIGRDPMSLSGHSTRVGMAQDLVAHGLELGEIMQAGRWRTPDMVARYTERQAPARGAVAKLFEKLVR